MPLPARKPPRLVQDGPVQLRVLAERIGTTKATASRSTDVLEAAGLVVRLPDPADGRSILIRATPAGRRARQEALQRLTEMVERLLATLEAGDRARFVELMERLDELL